MVVEQHFVVWGSISNSLTSARDVAPLQTLKPADPLFPLFSFTFYYFVGRLFCFFFSPVFSLSLEPSLRKGSLIRGGRRMAERDGKQARQETHCGFATEANGMHV